MYFIINENREIHQDKQGMEQVKLGQVKMGIKQLTMEQVQVNQGMLMEQVQVKVK